MSKNLLRPTSRGQITIPKPIRQKLNFNPDTVLNIGLEGDRIVIRPLNLGSFNRPIRVYSDEEIDRFLAEDKLSPEDAAFFQRLLR